MSIRQAWFGAALCAAITIIGVTPAFAPIYMKYDGIDGDVAAVDHRNWIEIDSYSFGAAQPSLRNATAAQTTGAGGPGTMTIRKRVDRASPKLSEIVVSRQRAPMVTLDLPAPAGQQGYYTYVLRDVIVSSYAGGGAGGTVPMESLSLNYQRVEWRYQPAAATRTLTAPPARAVPEGY